MYEDSIRLSAASENSPNLPACSPLDLLTSHWPFTTSAPIGRPQSQISLAVGSVIRDLSLDNIRPVLTPQGVAKLPLRFKSLHTKQRVASALIPYCTPTSPTFPLVVGWIEPCYSIWPTIVGQIGLVAWRIEKCSLQTQRDDVGRYIDTGDAQKIRQMDGQDSTGHR